ncbi:TPR_REGION domain-containing protein [Candidatus Nitrotoga sp. HW29]|uniref:tetratricopeptide repeat protein n=1 Tax=Candidatus Nitrotoga sp. HW29 TaxID=2886963 RepID=UPI001EF30952|nr:tetratricopeptide repeat protein [Candidatus Nitrotoga sp. HW29]CAH1903804.1 TPR_REGION domain-containing protein [Candidatus Nitrotoga sp. HW29]
MSFFSKFIYPLDRIKALSLALMVIVVYAPFFNNPLIFDDFAFFDTAIDHYANTLFRLDLRWFPYTTFGVTWVFFGEATPVFRIQNLLLHGMNVLLLLLVLRMWIKLFITDMSKENIANWGAWLGALIFACHPLAVYGVGYLIQRSILMATLFTLVMQLAYLCGLLEGDKRYMALAVLAYFLALFSKEHSLMAPAILLPLTWAIRAQNKLSSRVLLATWLGFALVGLLVVLRIKGIFGVPYEKDAAALFGEQALLQGTSSLHLLSVLTQAGLFFKYCLLMLVPNPAWMSIDMREPFILTWKEWTSWVGLVGFVAYGAFALVSLFRGGRAALFGLALLYPWCYFMAEFSSIRVQEIFVLYRSYLWLPGYMLLLPLVLSSLPSRKIMLVGALAVLLLVPLAWDRLWVFADKYRLWNDAVGLLHGEDRLGAHRTYFNRAQALAAVKNWDAAIADYQKSLAINSTYPEVNIALASAYSNSGRYPEALAEFDKVIAGNPKNASAYYGKSFVLKNLHNMTGAIQQMEKSCQLGLKQACIIVALNRQQHEKVSP